MNYASRISCHPNILGGKPAIRGTRIPIELILDLLSQGVFYPEIIQEYPDLKTEDILAAIAYAKETVATEEIGHFERIPETL